MAARNSRFLISALPVTLIAHLMGIAATTLVLVWTLHFCDGLALKSDNKLKIVNAHAVLMVIGFIFVAGEAIMAYKTIPASQKVQRAVHMALHLVALLVGILGVYAAFKFHREVGLSDMYSLHSWLGMGTICLFGLQWLLGFFSFWFPGAKSSARANYLPWHIFFGMAIFLLAICTAVSGLMQRFILLPLWHGKEALVVNFTGVAIVLFGLAVAFSAALRQYR